MPVDRASHVAADGTADEMDAIAQRNARHCAASLGQAAEEVPFVAVEGKSGVVRCAVLFDEAAERIEPIPQRGHTYMVSAAWHLRQLLPLVGRRVVGMVVRPINVLLRVSPNQVHAVAVRHRPGHLRTWNRQRRADLPASLAWCARRGIVGHCMLRMQFGQVDPAGLVQPFELALMVPEMLRAQQARNRQCGGRRSGDDEGATRQSHGLGPPRVDLPDASVAGRADQDAGRQPGQRA